MADCRLTQSHGVQEGGDKKTASQPDLCPQTDNNPSLQAAREYSGHNLNLKRGKQSKPLFWVALFRFYDGLFFHSFSPAMKKKKDFRSDLSKSPHRVFPVKVCFCFISLSASHRHLSPNRQDSRLGSYESRCCAHSPSSSTWPFSFHHLRVRRCPVIEPAP